ncbi:dihydrolipoyl dehydrogenase [Comamonas sp.]
MEKICVDIAIVGAGTAGISAFNALKHSGKSLLLIDEGPLGTTCARMGCMPSKAVLHAGKRWKTAKSIGADVSLPKDGPQRLWQQAIQTRDALTEGAAKRTQINAGEHLLMGHAQFVAPHLLRVGERLVLAKAFIVATGSSPYIPAAFAHLHSHILTTDTLFELEELPASIGIVGLGAIGLELGLALARLDVEVIATGHNHQIAGIADPEIHARALALFGKELPMWLGEPVTACLQGEQVHLQSGIHTASVDKLLVVAGRTPNIQGLHVEAAGLQPDTHGRLQIDPQSMRASDAPIFFAGDVQPDRPLLHEASFEGVAAAQAALAHLSEQDWTPRSRQVPLAILFSDPDVCHVGMGYAQAMSCNAVIGRADGQGNGRSKVMGATDNLLHIYVHPQTGRLLGASMLLTQGESLAHLIAWAIQSEQTVHELLDMPFYHPTIEEMLQSALKSAAHQIIN